jgi:hypothetical protein
MARIAILMINNLFFKNEKGGEEFVVDIGIKFWFGIRKRHKNGDAYT